MDKIDHKIEIWGGAECSFVRVKNNVYDQLASNGHNNRIGDLDLFDELGIKTIRYPLLWEHYAGNEKEFFRINDLRLNHLRELGIKPIAGLLHHGSGPFFTSLFDDMFPEMLAGFAFLIAERYPWIDMYTPVNEPLTTARFSGLYGIWYPHLRDDNSFLKIFLNELKAVALSMKAVKNINGEAKLVQTEDLCKIHSTAGMKYQADFENERRWLTYDILTGKMKPGHPMWNYLTPGRKNEKELEFFTENDTRPDICGFNYYVTSERYLDERKAIYPRGSHGNNGFQEYADIEAVRANDRLKISSGDLLEEAWNRYRLPVALTEIHLACTREEQLRWFNEAMINAVTLKNKGIDFRAVTAWSLVGSFDWSSLLCEKRNDYESGIFDIRNGKPRRTALAKMIKAINTGRENPYSHLLDIPGWWHRSDRFIYMEEGGKLNLVNEPENNNGRPLLIIGAKGSLGSAFAKICKTRGIRYVLTDRSNLDIASEESVNRTLSRVNPWGVINAAGFSHIDMAEKHAYTCFRENTTGPVILAETCRVLNIKLVTFSSDQVFNGKKNKPYTEDDSTGPVNLYGLSKSIAEEKILRINPAALIIRSGSFFNPWHRSDSLAVILRSAMSSSEPRSLPSDIVISPAYVPDLVQTVLDLMIDDESGIKHLSNQQEISSFEFARQALDIAGLNKNVISPVLSSGLKYAALRPLYSVLKSSSGILLPFLENAIKSYLDEFLKEPALVMDQLSL